MCKLCVCGNSNHNAQVYECCKAVFVYYFFAMLQSCKSESRVSD